LSIGVERTSIAFHTTSLATREIERMGYPAYYVPSKTLRPDLTTDQWNELFARGLRDVIETHEVNLVVFDGVVAYGGLTTALAMSPRTRAVWISRGGWKQVESHVSQLERSHKFFSQIIVPGEIRSTIASDFDGISRELASKLVFVNPLVLLAEDALLDRDEALEHLRLPPDRSHLLIQLGAGNINDTSGQFATVVRELRERFPEAELTLAQSAIANEAPQVPGKVHVVQKYPLSRYYRAFDLVVTAAGYNSLHECLLYGIPTVVIPNVETTSDNQIKRAERAAAAMRVEAAHPFSAHTFRGALSRLFGAGGPEHLRQSWQPYLTENGAEQAASVIRELLLESSDDRPDSRPAPSPPPP
jgi:UDP:flavonoid glycosyltransferase YjiC (YdhE family)